MIVSFIISLKGIMLMMGFCLFLKIRPGGGGGGFFRPIFSVSEICFRFTLAHGNLFWV